MAFKWAYNEYGAPVTRLSNILATDSEAFTEGEALKLASGKWTKATNGVAVAGFAGGTYAAGTGQYIDVIQAREGDVFDALYTGTPDATFYAGTAADVSADGLSVKADDVTGGMFAIMSVNTTNTTCRVKVKTRQLS